MMTQLINTGAKQKVAGKQGKSSSDQKDFEKMLEQAGQQQGFTAGENSADNGTVSAEAPTENAAATAVEEPGTEELSIAAALVTAQPMIPVETFTPVTVEEVMPAATEAIAPQADVFAEQQTATPLDIGTQQQQQQEGDNAFGQAAADLAQPEQNVETETEATVETVAEDTEAPKETVEVSEHQQVHTEETDDTEPEVEDASAAAEAPVFDRMETIPVKVAETGEPVEAEADDAAEQIMRHIEQAITQGESRVEISLTPENLGQLTVEITRSGDGTLSIVLTTVNEKAANLIDRHAASLQQMLMDGTQNVHVEVETRTPETQAQQFLNPDGQNNHHHQQQRRQHKEENRSDGDFLQQLRLGLVGMD